MPEENFSTPLPVKIKKSKKRVIKRSAKGGKTGKPPFLLSDSLPAAPMMPRADYKIEESLTVKPGQAKSIYGKLAFSFVALTVILVAAVLYFNFSKVTIVIIPAKEKISDSSTVDIVNQTPAAALGSGQIFGIVKQIPMELSRTFNSGGKEILGQEVSGQVTIINNYLKNQPLVASTRLLSADNKLFRLKNTVNVPAGGQVEAEVYADEVKPEMAVGPGKFTLPGLWAGIQDKIYAQSAEPMVYSEKVKYVIRQSDIDNAVSALKQELSASAKKQISQAYPDYDQLLFQADNNSISQEVSGKVGEEKQTFSIKLKTMVAMAAFKGGDVFNQVNARLLSSLADDKEIAEFSQSDLNYELGNFNLSQALATVKVTAAAQLTLKDSASIIKKNNLTGLTKEELKVYLNRLPEVAGYEIKFFPSFIKKTPKLADRIEIVIKR
ncbi:MAG: hypothetical protein Q7R92_01700 [bacterium]|nr:hypothetical protein [bacterium]